MVLPFTKKKKKEFPFIHSPSQKNRELRHQELLPKYLSETRLSSNTGGVLGGQCGLCLNLSESCGSPVHNLPARKEADITKPILTARNIWLHAGTMRQERRKAPPSHRNINFRWIKELSIKEENIKQTCTPLRVELWRWSLPPLD